MCGTSPGSILWPYHSNRETAYASAATMSCEAMTRSGRSTFPGPRGVLVRRVGRREGITEALKGMNSLEKASVTSGFQWVSGSTDAQVDTYTERTEET